MRRVVVTGMGTVNPLGLTVDQTWKKILAGQSGIRKITAFDASDMSCNIAGEVAPGFDALAYFSQEDGKNAKRLDPFVHYAMAAAREALAQAGIPHDTSIPRERIGVCIGTGIGGIHTHVKQTETFLTKGHKRVSPFYIPALIGNIGSGFLAACFDFRGPNLSIQTACATGNHSIGTALHFVQSGMADVMITGGSEGTILPICVAGFANMRALSTGFNDTPEKSSRPFDKSRDGFVMAEGSGVLVLEAYEHAVARGAEIFAEVLGVGMSADAYDLVQPHPEGVGVASCMKMALEISNIRPEEIDYINAHATSTPLGDVAECKAIRRVLNDDQSRVHVGSTKSMTGHMLGAASGIEAIFCIQAIRHSVVPPNINIDELDADTGMTCINKTPVEKKIRVAISNSFGFGGHNSTLCLRAV